MKHLLLASIIPMLSSCMSLHPIVLSGRYTLPGGKGVIAISIPLRPALPQPQQSQEPKAELFPVNQK
jgi:hypothetical protein